MDGEEKKDFLIKVTLKTDGCCQNENPGAYEGDLIYEKAFDANTYKANNLCEDIMTLMTSTNLAKTKANEILTKLIKEDSSSQNSLA